MRDLISIIVPIYQVKPYLRDCIESVLAQSYPDWELLLVDDGSTDGGELICDEYARIESRIKVFHQQNTGLSAARNTGLDNISGQYIAFLDADDVFLDKDSLKIMLQCIKKEQAQACVCRSQHFYGQIPTEKEKPSFDGTKILSGRDIFYPLPFDREGYYYAAVTARLFRRECFDGIRFPLDRISEDDAIAAELFYPIERLAYIGSAFYGYRIRNDSISHSTSRIRYYIDTIQNYEEQRSFFSQRKETDLVEQVERNIRTCKLRFLCFCEDEKILFDIPEDKRPNPRELLISADRRGIWDGLNELDPEYSSVCADVFFDIELKYARYLFALALCFLGISKKPVYSTIEPHIKEIIDMADEEKLSVLASQALISYDELPCDKKEKYILYESYAIRSALRLKHRGAAAESAIIRSLYPHLWYRDCSDFLFHDCDAAGALRILARRLDEPTSSAPLHFLDLLDVILLMREEKNAVLFDTATSSTCDTLRRLCEKLMQYDMLYEDWSTEEAGILLAILKQNNDRKGTK